MFCFASTETMAYGQWAPDPEIAGRGGAAGAAGGLLAPLRPAQLPLDGTWHVRLDRHVPFGVSEAATVGARLGRTNGRSAWLGSVQSVKFDAYASMMLVASYMQPITRRRGIRAGASAGWNHERMGLLGARNTPVVAVGVTWRPYEQACLAVTVLSSRAVRLHGWVAAADATYEFGRSWPQLHASATVHPEFGPSWHLGSTWAAMKRVQIDIGGANNPFRTAASIRIRTGSVLARFAFEWQPEPGLSRWVSVGWS
jgi:hypothetical protein